MRGERGARRQLAARKAVGCACGEERVAHEERPDTCLRARAGMRAGGAGVAACVSAGSGVESTRRWSRGCRCRGTAAASPRVPRGRRSSSLTRGMVSEHGGARWGGCRVAGVHLVLGEERVSTSLGRSQRSPQLGETRRRCGVSGGGLGCRAGG
jgi:hypothetical protein